MARSPHIPKYLLSLPERVLRSASGLAGGLLHEIGEATLPDGVRRSKLYTNLVDLTLRFMIESLGQVEGVFPNEEKLNEDFVLRRTAGGGLEMIGLLVFQASPVWVLAALSDVTGAGRYLLGDITNALKVEGLIAPDTEARSVDQLLDALESSSGWAADTINSPPLDIAGLRTEWSAIKREFGQLSPSKLPSEEALTSTWQRMRAEAEAQNRSMFEMSTVMALSAVGSLPERMYWLSRSARLAGQRTGVVLGGPLLEHYRKTLGDIHREGFTRYWISQFRPYLRSAASQFSPGRESWTERVLSARKPSDAEPPPNTPNSGETGSPEAGSGGDQNPDGIMRPDSDGTPR